MARVIKECTEQQKECSNCLCTIGYTRNDIKQEQIHMNEFKYYVECPRCGHHITIKGEIQKCLHHRETGVCY